MQISQKLYQAGSYLSYWLQAVNEHSLHPPFVFSLYTKVIKADGQEASFSAFENSRQLLLKSQETLSIQELGAGSSISQKHIRPIRAIARHSLTSASFSRLLYRLIRFMQAETILELGSSLGINTLYLAAAAPKGCVWTFEGCPQTAAWAKKAFDRHKANNIRLIEGNIDDTLPQLLKHELKSVDAAYIDANHTYEASVRYFDYLLPHLHEGSFVVIDDIYWSKGMQKAWQEIKRHPRVSLSLNLYDAGILFFQPGLQPEHYVLWY